VLLMDPECNPYEPPPAPLNTAPVQAIARPSVWKTVGRSVVCALAGTVLGVVLGAILGCLIYPFFPSFFNNTIYSPEMGFGDAYNVKVHIQTSIRIARDGADYSFWIGLIVPWLFWIKGWFRGTRGE
jgi:hypothetical protein